MNVQHPSPKVRKGFTLVELAVVIVIIGVLAAFGVPKFLNSVERSKAAEAFAYLAAVRTAQERYIARQGVYTDEIIKLDIAIQPPKYFDDGDLTVTNAGNDPTWEMTLTRKAASSSKGAYTVTFTQEGYDSESSSIEQKPEINPSGTTGAAAPVTP